MSDQIPMTIDSTQVNNMIQEKPTLATPPELPDTDMIGLSASPLKREMEQEFKIRNLEKEILELDQILDDRNEEIELLESNIKELNEEIQELEEELENEKQKKQECKKLLHDIFQKFKTLREKYLELHNKKVIEDKLRNDIESNDIIETIIINEKKENVNIIINDNSNLEKVIKVTDLVRKYILSKGYKNFNINVKTEN
jgi:vacuolar-type H+-ATPase subunit I/STV1